MRAPQAGVIKVLGGNLRACLARTRVTRTATPFVPPSHPPTLAPAAPPAPEHWARQLMQRGRYLMLLKLAGVTAFMWVFFTAYFHILRNPVRPVFEMPLTPLDHAVVPQPWAFAAYVSLWIYVGIVPGMMLRVRETLLYGAWAAALCITGLAIFYLAPTAVPPPHITADLSQHAGFALLNGVDASGNACPSLHVATALFSAVWVAALLRHVGAPPWLRMANWVWLLLIVYSTLAIKQHVALDALAGAALGGAFAWASTRWWVPAPWLPTRWLPRGAR